VMETAPLVTLGKFQETTEAALTKSQVCGACIPVDLHNHGGPPQKINSFY
jgi:hypothetical protein